MTSKTSSKKKKAGKTQIPTHIKDYIKNCCSKASSNLELLICCPSFSQGQSQFSPKGNEGILKPCRHCLHCYSVSPKSSLVVKGICTFRKKGGVVSCGRKRQWPSTVILFLSPGKQMGPGEVRWCGWSDQRAWHHRFLLSQAWGKKHGLTTTHPYTFREKVKASGNNSMLCSLWQSFSGMQRKKRHLAKRKVIKS